MMKFESSDPTVPSGVKWREGSTGHYLHLLFSSVYALVKPEHISNPLVNGGGTILYIGSGNRLNVTIDVPDPGIGGWLWSAGRDVDGTNCESNLPLHQVKCCMGFTEEGEPTWEMDGYHDGFFIRLPRTALFTLGVMTAIMAEVRKRLVAAAVSEPALQRNIEAIDEYLAQVERVRNS